MNDPRSIELEVLARLQTAISASLTELFKGTPSRDYVINDELAQTIASSDKMIFVYRAIADMIQRGMPKRFDSQEAELLDQLQRSKEMLDQRNIENFLTQKNIDAAIGYLGLEDGK